MPIIKYLSILSRKLEALNVEGVPVPMIKDPKTNKGSVSLTLVFISSITVILSIFAPLIESKAGGSINISQSMEFFWTSCALYFGRKLSVSQDEKKISNEEQSESK